MSVVLTGALVKVFINNLLLKEAQSVAYDIDFAENAIYGIDSSWPQEIASGRCSVMGQISGIKLKNSGGLQSYKATPNYRNIVASPYISIRIEDRHSGEILVDIPYAKVKKQSTQIGIKSTVKFSFSFEGIIAYEPLDRV